MLLLPKGGAQRGLLLRFRSGKSLLLPDSVSSAVSAAGAVWLYDTRDHRLHRIDPESAALTPVPQLAGAGRRLGKDTADWLWFESDRPPVKAGEPLPLVRWNPSSGVSEIVTLPTQGSAHALAVASRPTWQPIALPALYGPTCVG